MLLLWSSTDSKALQPSRMSPTLMFLVVQVLSSAGSPVILSLKQTGFFSLNEIYHTRVSEILIPLQAVLLLGYIHSLLNFHKVPLPTHQLFRCVNIQSQNKTEQVHAFCLDWWKQWRGCCGWPWYSGLSYFQMVLLKMILLLKCCQWLDNPATITYFETQFILTWLTVNVCLVKHKHYKFFSCNAFCSTMCFNSFAANHRYLNNIVTKVHCFHGAESTDWFKSHDAFVLFVSSYIQDWHLAARPWCILSENQIWKTKNTKICTQRCEKKEVMFTLFIKKADEKKGFGRKAFQHSIWINNFGIVLIL